MPRNRPIRFMSAAVAAVAVAACSSSPSTSTPAATVLSASTTVPELVDAIVPVDDQLPSTSLTPSAVGDPATLTAGPGAELAVSGGNLPQSVMTGITSNGGEVADTSSWDARFETYGLPRVAGPGVKLVGATLDVSVAEGVPGSWARTDGLQWLFMDSSRDGVNAMLDDMARSAGLESWSVTASPSIVNGANCVVRDYWNETTTSWKLQGCDFPVFAGMYSVGVTRTGIFTQGPPIVDPSVSAVAAAAGGEVTKVSVTFDHPATAQSVVTLSTSTAVNFVVVDDEAISALAGGPLAGWTHSPGEGSIMFTGGLGTRWVVGSGQAWLSGQGRLVL